MSDEKPKNEEPKNKVVLTLAEVPAQDKDGNPKLSCEKPECPERTGGICPDGEPVYKQEDVAGLFHLLNRYDNTKHPGAMKGYRSLLSVRDKVDGAMINKSKELVLTIDEAAWLKEYLERLPNNEAAQQKLAQYELRTLLSIVDQLS